MEFTLANGTIVDGTGSPGYRADLRIEGGAITAIAPALPPRGAVIDVGGRVVCPGIIDMHSHSALMGLVDPKLEAKIQQGVTTEVTGPDGYSAAPIRAADVIPWRTHLAGLEGNPSLEWDWSSFGEYRGRLRGTSTNWAPLVGHGNLRLTVAGMENRPATESELLAMAELLDSCFEEGAFALSTGLIYTPQAYSNLAELVALGRVVARRGKFFDFHMRTQGAFILQAIEEVLEVGRQSGCAIHICHFQLGARSMWGKIGQAVELIEAARRSGVEVTCDQHVYTAGSTMLGALLPLWAHAGGPDRLRELLRSREDLPRLERDTVEGMPPGWESRFQTTGPENIYISSVRSERNQGVVGKSLTQIADEWGASPFEVVVRLLLEEDFAVGMILFQLSETDVEAIMRLPWQMFCTDAVLIGKPHPRAYGSYPRVLGHYVRERRVLRLEEAIRKATAVPAARLGLRDRGVLAPGKAADLLVFDPATVIDRSTYEDPRQYPTGVSHVFVNGRLVVANGRHTGELPGGALES
ncbi:MAG: N-acyl-D-amino-acid deacylase family protein [Chloroflexota bacterium]